MYCFTSRRAESAYQRSRYVCEREGPLYFGSGAHTFLFRTGIPDRRKFAHAQCVAMAALQQALPLVLVVAALAHVVPEEDHEQQKLCPEHGHFAREYSSGAMRETGWFDKRAGRYRFDALHDAGGRNSTEIVRGGVIYAGYLKPEPMCEAARCPEAGCLVLSAFLCRGVVHCCLLTLTITSNKRLSAFHLPWRKVQVPWPRNLPEPDSRCRRVRKRERATA